MAIIIRDKTPCSICGRILRGEDDVVMTPHFIGDSADMFWHYSDSGMHRPCFLAWPLKESFTQRFNEVSANRAGPKLFMQWNGDITPVVQ